MDYYILDEGHHAVKVTLLQWARWWDDPDHRRVALDETRLFEVSTVFLGVDHRWGKGPPILFETMVFEREAEIREIWGRLVPVRPDIEQLRYCSWDDAVTGHQATLSRLRKVEADTLAALTKTKAKKST